MFRLSSTLPLLFLASDDRADLEEANCIWVLVFEDAAESSVRNYLEVPEEAAGCDPRMWLEDGCVCGPDTCKTFSSVEVI